MSSSLSSSSSSSSSRSSSSWRRLAVGLALALAATAGCGGRTPATRYYDLVAPTGGDRAGTAVLILEPLTTDDAYDDERIVYRTSPYRLDYYDYHRWSAPPGVMVSNYLETALERGGLFRAVVREPTADATTILSGRVAVIEEVDVSRKQWQGRIVVELRLADARTGAELWADQYEEIEPLDKQTPEGLAEALSRAMARIATAAGPAIAAHASATGTSPAPAPVATVEPPR